MPAAKIRYRIREEIARLDRHDEERALTWIESVSEFDEAESDVPDPALQLGSSVKSGRCIAPQLGRKVGMCGIRRRG
jgi:hypothetical protein